MNTFYEYGLGGFTPLKTIAKTKVGGLEIEYKTWRSGKQGFTFEITDKDFTDFVSQVKDTISFLTTKEKQLTELKQCT